MNHSQELGKLALAKARAQVNFKSIDKDLEATISSRRTGGTFTYSYADLAACLDAVMPSLSDEGLALLQPLRVEEGPPTPDGGRTGVVVVTCLLIHGESGQWISEECRLPVADISDPRSIGSAATYARRYAVTSLLCVASTQDDDDARQARGGDHEQTPAKGSKACPACGVIGAMIQSKPEYGGGWVCWKNRDGCGTKYPPGPFPTSVPETDMMPTQKQPEKTANEIRVEAGFPPLSQAIKGPLVVVDEPGHWSKRHPIVAMLVDELGWDEEKVDAWVKLAVPGTLTLARIEKNVIPELQEEITKRALPMIQPRPEHVGSGTPEAEAGGSGGEVPAVPGTPASKTETPVHASPAPGVAGPVLPATPSPVTFTINGVVHQTQGLTKEQFMETAILAPKVDKKVATKGYAKVLLAKVLGMKVGDASCHRNNLTEAGGETWIAEMRKVLGGDAQATL